MTMNDMAAVLRELAIEVRKQVGGNIVMFSVHEGGALNGMVTICSLDAEVKFDSYENTPAGIVMVHAYTPKSEKSDTMPALDNPPF